MARHTRSKVWGHSVHLPATSIIVSYCPSLLWRSLCLVLWVLSVCGQSLFLCSSPNVLAPAAFMQRACLARLAVGRSNLSLLLLLPNLSRSLSRPNPARPAATLAQSVTLLLLLPNLSRAVPISACCYSCPIRHVHCRVQISACCYSCPIRHVHCRVQISARCYSCPICHVQCRI